MARYLLGRLLVAVGLVYAVVTLIFLFLHLVPGDPAELLLSGGGSAPSAASVAALRHELGLDKPLPAQYVDYLNRLVHLDLGRSFQNRRPVAADIAQRLPRTLELIVAAAVLALLAGIPLGVLAARNRGGPVDAVVSLLVSSGISVPVFVVGTILVLVFALDLNLFPAGGYTAFTENPAKHVSQLVLPAISIAFGLTAVLARMARSAVLEVLGQDWVRTARAKGLSPARVLSRHVLRNSLSPVVTVLGLQLGALLGGTVLVEFVFNWPGLSSLLVQAAAQRDYPLVQGIVLVISVLFVALNLLVDLAYSVLDPRVRYG
jgi:peptide/nickel transport system permease protein